MIATCAQQLCSSLAQCLIIACMHICMGLAPQLKLSPCPAAACPGGLVSRREHQCCHQLQHVTCVGLNMQLAKDEACSMQRCTGRRGGGGQRASRTTRRRQSCPGKRSACPTLLCQVLCPTLVQAWWSQQAACCRQAAHAMPCHVMRHAAWDT